MSDKIMALQAGNTRQHREIVHLAVGLNLSLPDLGNVGRVQYCRLSLQRKHTGAGKNINVRNYKFTGRYCQLFCYNKSIFIFMHISKWWDTQYKKIVSSHTKDTTHFDLLFPQL